MFCQVICWLLISFLGTFLFAGIIAYKRHGSLNYQTLIDKVMEKVNNNSIIISRY